MVDNPKKKKRDRKRIALKQKHEVDYLKKIAKRQIYLLEHTIKHPTDGAWQVRKRVGVPSLIRICKALLKCLKLQKQSDDLRKRLLKYTEKLLKLSEKRLNELSKKLKKRK